MLSSVTSPTKMTASVSSSSLSSAMTLTTASSTQPSAMTGLSSPAAMTALSSQPTVLTTTAVITSSSGGEQVRTLIPVTTSNGSKVFVSGPCILLKTANGLAPTVAQQMQALRPLLKADNKNNTIINNNNNKTDNSSSLSQTTIKNNNNNNNNSKTSTSNGGANENEPEALRCKRRIDFSSLGLPRPQPAAMARRNERERNRVKQVNLGFETLRQHVPTGKKNKKLSKVDTLKEAVRYIKYLQQLLQEAETRADEDLNTVISDTINIVSRPTTSTTVTSTSTDAAATSADVSSPSPSLQSPLSVASTATSLEEMTTTVTDTQSITDSLSAADLLQLTAAAMDIDSSVVMDTSGLPLTHSAPLHQGAAGLNGLMANQVDSQAHVSSSNQIPLSLDENQVAMVENQPHLSAEVTQTHLTLADPHAQLSFLGHPAHFAIQPSPDMPPPPSATPVLTPSSTTSSSSQTTFYFSASSSPECSPVSILGLQNLKLHSNPGSCRGSDGASCPVSPSESLAASEASNEYEDLRDMECESWQDLSADIKDWLCSKIDIDDPEVFA